MMSLSDLTVLSLACWQAVEVFRHSKLEWLVDLKARWTSVGDGVASWRLFVALLLDCMWCLSVWVGFLLMICYLASPAIDALDMTAGEESFAEFAAFCGKGLLKAALLISRVFIGGLAVSRLANLGNDVAHYWCRTHGCDGKDPPRS